MLKLPLGIGNALKNSWKILITTLNGQAVN
jgi:hypothetical protein